MQAEAKKRSGPIIEDWIKKASAKGVDAKAILAEFHAELKKVARQVTLRKGAVRTAPFYL